MADSRALKRWSTAALALTALATAGQAQVFVNNTTDIPSGGSANNSFSENIDFGDVDLDGDWDAVFADGGDQGNDQNRIWINRGGLQNGTVGVFLDDTAARFPSVQDDSRDIEFADIDGDADLDLYISNTAQLSPQSNRWWINRGGINGGNLGFYQDQSNMRWVGLNSANSSIPASALISGGFIDWSCDCDFGDLDNDGDLDLVHSTYGGAFNGNVPTRIFLNDGRGFFTEYNPSGFKLTGNNISNGDPGLWCEGTQQANTSNITGANCDIASSPLDIDLGDIDHDYDLDILHGARQELPRMFRNNLAETNWVPRGFRDITGSSSGSGVFPNNYSDGDGHYEQEFGDFDGDGDLDIYGLNWRSGGFGFDDITLKNDGTGNFDSLTILSGSDSDDNEGDFIDYDNDGDLDLYVANFSGTDRLYRNDGSGNYTLLSTGAAGLSGTSSASLDADACDVDNDGDYDVFIAMDSGVANQYRENVTNTPDTHAPYIPRVENPGAQVSAPGGLPIRAQVYDNAPYYITWYNDTNMTVTVDGCELTSLDMMSSGGQIFRAVVPKNLDGSVQVRVNSADEYGNTGFSAPVNYSSTAGVSYQSLFGSGNPGVLGEPTIDCKSVPFAGTTLYIVGANAISGQPHFFALASAALGSPIPIGTLLTLNIGGMALATKGGTTDANGCAKFAIPLSSNTASGITFYAQWFVAPGTGGFTFASSKGLAITTQ